MKITRTAETEQGPVVAATVEREFPVAIERAFRAWMEPRLLIRWIVPRGASVASVSVDPREGGHYRIEGFLADGAAFSISGTYLIVDEPTKLTMSWRHDGPAGPLDDGGSIVTVTFTACHARSTRVRVTHERRNVRRAIGLPRYGVGEASEERVRRSAPWNGRLLKDDVRRLIDAALEARTARLG